MKSGQLINIKLKIMHFKNHAENESGRLVQAYFSYVFEKIFIWSKCNWLVNFGKPRLGHTINNKHFKASDYWSRDMLNFAFFKKCLGLVTPPYLRILFQQKLFFHVIFFNWLNFIVWWPLLLEILSKMYILIICATACCMVKLSLILRPY